eukprot:gene762-4052_t
MACIQVACKLGPRTILNLCRSSSLPLVQFSAGLHTAQRYNAAMSRNTTDTSGLSHWKLERAVSVALVGLVPAAFVAPGPFVDYSLAVAMPLHTYMGMDVVLTDYVRDSLKPLAKFLNATIHTVTLGGLLYFNAHDVGVCEGLKMIWAL